MKIEVGSEWISDSDSSMEFLVLGVDNTSECLVKYEVYSNGHYIGESESNKYTFLFSKSPISSIQEQAYDEGYDQAIDDLIEAGLIGEDEEGYLDEEYSEYEFGDVDDEEEEYCFSKELDRILNSDQAQYTIKAEKFADGGKEEGVWKDSSAKGYDFKVEENGAISGFRITEEKDGASMGNRYDENGKLSGFFINTGNEKIGGIKGSERKHSHYFKDVRHLDYIDVYQVCKLFPVDDDSGAITHARKKLLVAGGRGAGKDMIKDITEARDTLNRYLQIEGIEQ